jgi:alcohol dehydrogenase (cytochrome c)
MKCVLIYLGFASLVSAQPTLQTFPITIPGPSSIYVSQCASCHGATGTGASAGSILPFLRYHTDLELVQKIADAHTSSVQLSAAQQASLSKELRGMTGTNPNMATAGYTGVRGNSGATKIEPIADFPTKPVWMPTQVTLKLANGETLSGKLVAQTETDATLLANDGHFHLLSRSGGMYREKPIAPKADWLDNHGDKTGNRYSPIEQINQNNVRRLSRIWEFPIPTSARLQATPVVIDGIMYMVGWNEIYAIDATSGEQVWHYSEPRHDGILGEAGSGANRGATISGNRVFMVTDHAHVLAFNRMTGAKLWDAEMADYRQGYSATASPLVAGDLVIAGVACGEEGCRGFLDAYDAATGKRAWRFYTIPARGEPGSETWRGQALEHGCGTTWLTGSYDQNLSLIYWGTGNPCPDFVGDERIGDNLYTSSVIALDSKTGRLRWHYQFTPHDVHDWDSTQPMLLVDEIWQGQPRKLLLHVDKNGMFYVLDRTNGKFLRGSPFASMVTWNSGFDKNGRPVLSQPDIVCPSTAVNWTDVAYSHKTKLLYGRVTDTCGMAIPTEGAIDPLANNRWFGAVARRTQPPQEIAQRLQEIREKYPPGPRLRAVDLATGRKVWDYDMGSGRSTGVLATAGNLLFVGGMGGIVALDATTGERLSYVDAGQMKCDGVCHEASAMTYMVGGKQYIALSGYGTLIAYSLGEERLTTLANPGEQLANQDDLQGFPAAPGRDLTLRTCTSCHGAGLWSGSHLSERGWADTIDRMRVRGLVLTDDEHRTVLDYLTKNFGITNVNTASAAEMIRGLRITQRQAENIVSYREKNGPFKSLEDLKRIEGLEPAAVDARKNMIVF